MQKAISNPSSKHNLTLKEAALQNEIITQNITVKELDRILDPETYVGLAIQQAQMIIEEINAKRLADDL